MSAANESCEADVQPNQTQTDVTDSEDGSVTLSR